MRCIVLTTNTNKKLQKILIGVIIIGIGSYFLSQGLINYNGYQNCIERRERFTGMENVPLALTFECYDLFTNSFIIAGIIMAIGVVILNLAFLNVSMWSLRREGTQT